MVRALLPTVYVSTTDSLSGRLIVLEIERGLTAGSLAVVSSADGGQTLISEEGTPTSPVLVLSNVSPREGEAMTVAKIFSGTLAVGAFPQPSHCVYARNKKNRPSWCPFWTTRSQRIHHTRLCSQSIRSTFASSTSRNKLKPHAGCPIFQSGTVHGPRSPPVPSSRGSENGPRDRSNCQTWTRARTIRRATNSLKKW